jgi:hypothetical protein
MVVDREHHKDKAVYQGTWPSCASISSSTTYITAGSSKTSSTTAIKVSVSRIFSATNSRSTCEVSCSSPQLQELLQQLLMHDRLSDEEQRMVPQHMSNIVFFAQATAHCMAAGDQ